MIIEIKGKKFKKSSHSGGSACVGVAIENEKIHVVNTKEGQTTVVFNREEWLAFIRGVKDGEFDV